MFRTVLKTALFLIVGTVAVGCGDDSDDTSPAMYTDTQVNQPTANPSTADQSSTMPSVPVPAAPGMETDMVPPAQPVVPAPSQQMNDQNGTPMDTMPEAEDMPMAQQDGLDVQQSSDGACDNDGDTAVLDSVADSLEGTITGCVTSCLLDSNRSVCTSECAFGETTMSMGCKLCFGAIFECTLTQCALQCAAGSSSDGCVTCRANNCNDDFVACAGIPPTQ